MEVRRFEARGLIRRRFWSCFHSALIEGGRCYGAILFDEASGGLVLEHADALVIATGGQNALFGKTTGSTQCDGYAAGKLFLQGVDLKNLEFIQYHPTTLETPQKRMLVSEAVRGEGGRLFYLEGDERVYFMEEKYGSRGNLMPRDIVSQEIAATGRAVYLDAAFLGKRVIDERLPEVRDVCQTYRGIDIAKEPIPVAPAVHFFMGGIAVDNQHETNVENLFAIGECASIYHGANRLGGNSLLAAVYSGWVAADAIASRGIARFLGGAFRGGPEAVAHARDLEHVSGCVHARYAGEHHEREAGHRARPSDARRGHCRGRLLPLHCRQDQLRPQRHDIHELLATRHFGACEGNAPLRAASQGKPRRALPKRLSRRSGFPRVREHRLL